MSSKEPLTPDFGDNEFLKRNYYLLGRYLLYLVDLGLEYVKEIYIKDNAENEFQEFSARSFYTFVIKTYIRKKVKHLLKIILNTAVLCLKSGNVGPNGLVNPDYLDEIIKKKFYLYQKYDMTLAHTKKNHPGHLELKTIAQLTFRVSVIQATRILMNKDSGVVTYYDLVRETFHNMQECRHSLNSILWMVDQMVDTFERYGSDIVQIEFYKPTYQTRNFEYVRRLYEYALDKLDRQIRDIFINEGHEKIPKFDGDNDLN